MKSIYLLFFTGLFTLNMLAQSVNSYKYVLVLDKYEWAQEADQYQINSLTTFLFKKYGFDAYQLGSELPENINESGCNTLTADVKDDSSFIKTKLKVILKDCKGEVVFISEEGTSRLKEYKPAYHEALRNAFLSIEALGYAYTGKNTTPTPKVAPPKKPTPPAIDKNVPLEETSKKLATATEVDKVAEIDRYKSADGTYNLEVSVGNMIFYEGKNVIGKLSPKAGSYYEIVTSEFSGKGYFLNDQFIIEREIKGVQGIVKMIFDKQ